MSQLLARSPAGRYPDADRARDDLLAFLREGRARAAAAAHLLLAGSPAAVHAALPPAPALVEPGSAGAVPAPQEAAPANQPEPGEVGGAARSPPEPGPAPLR
jgi:hypothetical protein